MNVSRSLEFLKYPLLFLLASWILITGCGQDAELRFRSLLKEYQHARYQLYPVTASLNGQHDYDHLLHIPGETIKEREVEFCTHYLDRLDQIKVQKLSAPLQFEYNKMKQQLEARWKQLHFSDQKIDASHFDPGLAIRSVLHSKEISLEERLKKISQRLVQIPDYLAGAKQELQRDSVERLDLALQFQHKTFRLLDKELPDSIGLADLHPDSVRLLRDQIYRVQLAVKDFTGFCNSLKLQQGEE